VHTPPTYLIRRLVSFLEFGVMMTLTIAFVFLLVILPTIIGIFEKFIPQDLLLPLHSFFLGDKDLSYYLLLIYGFLLVCMAYYNLPSRKQKFLNVLPGAVFAVIGWTTFSMLFTYYIADFPQVNLIYGSIAGIIIALLYFYICSIILIIGAELNYHLEKSSHE
jgi:membrane protein